MLDKENEEVSFGMPIQLYTKVGRDKKHTRSTIVGKRFNLHSVDLVPQTKLHLMENYDNSYFVFENSVRSEEIHSQVLFRDSVRIKHICSGQYLMIDRKNSGIFQTIGFLDEYPLNTKHSADSSDDEKQEVQNIDTQLFNASVFTIVPIRSFEKMLQSVKMATKFLLYNQYFNLYISNEIIDDVECLVASGEPSAHHRGWRLDHDPNYGRTDSRIDNYDLIYITNRNSNGKLTIYEGQDKKVHKIIEDPNNNFPLKTEPLSFSCLWRVTNLKINIYDDFIGGFEQEQNLSDEEKFAIISMADQIYELVKEPESKPLVDHGNRSAITLTHVNTGQPISQQTTIIFSSTDSLTDHCMTLYSGDFIRISHKSEWLVKDVPQENQKRLVRSQKGSADKASTFRIYRLDNHLKLIVLDMMEIKNKISTFFSMIKNIHKRQCRKKEKTMPFDRYTIHYKNTCREIITIFRYLEQKLKKEDKLLYQTISCDIGLLQILSNILSQIYKITIDKALVDYIKPLHRKIVRIFLNLHSTFRLACANNSYVKQKTLQQRACELLYDCLKSTSTYNDIEMETFKEMLSTQRFSEETVLRPRVIKRIVGEYKKLPKKSLEKQYLFLRMLRLLCRNNNRVIARNQRTIIKYVILNKKIEESEEDSLNFTKIGLSLKGDPKHSYNTDIVVKMEPGGTFILDKLFATARYYMEQEGQKNENGIHPPNLFGSLRNESSGTQQKKIRKFRRNNYEKDKHGNPSIHKFQKDQKSIRKIIYTWKVLEEWIELLADVSQSRNIHGQWVAQTILNQQMIMVLLQQKRRSMKEFQQRTIKLKSFIRLLGNMLVHTVNNEIMENSRVWLLRSLTMRSYEFEKNERCQSFVQEHTTYPYFKQFIQRYLNIYNTMFGVQNIPIEKGFEYFQKERKHHHHDQVTTEVVEISRRIFSILRYMVLYDVWDRVHQKFMGQRRLINDLLEILNTGYSCKSFSDKKQILGIVLFYLEEQNIQRVYDLVTIINNEWASDDLGTSIKENVQENRLTEGRCRILIATQLKRSKLYCMSDEAIYRLDQVLLRFMSISIKQDLELYLLCLKIKQKITEVQRNSHMSFLHMHVFQFSRESLKVVKIIKRLRQALDILVDEGDLQNIELGTQYLLHLPIWSVSGPCLVKLILDIIESMKYQGLKDERRPKKKVNYLKIYLCLGSFRRMQHPFNEMQQPVKDMQYLLMSMGIIEKCLQFLSECDINSVNKLYRRLIQAIYAMLAVAMWNNTQCQLLFKDHWRMMIRHARNSPGALMALREYCRCSYWLQCDGVKVKEIIDQVTKYLTFCVQHDTYYRRASRYLDFFECLIYYKNRYLDEARLHILMRLMDSDCTEVSNPRFLRKKQEFMNVIEKNQRDLSLNRLQSLKPVHSTQKLLDPQPFLEEDEHQHHENIAVFSRSPKLTYVIVLLRLLADLVKNLDINRTKITRLYPFEHLSTILYLGKNFYGVKAGARTLLNNAYYYKFDLKHFDIALHIDLELISRDLCQYVYERLKNPQLEELEYDFQVRQVHPVSMLTQNLNQILTSLELLLRMPQGTSVLRQISNVSEESIPYETLEDQHPDDTSFLTALVDFLQSKSQNALRQFRFKVFCKFFRIYELLKFLQRLFNPIWITYHRIHTLKRILELRLFQIDFQKHYLKRKPPINFDYYDIIKDIVRNSVRELDEGGSEPHSVSLFEWMHDQKDYLVTPPPTDDSFDDIWKIAQKTFLTTDKNNSMAIEKWTDDVTFRLFTNDNVQPYIETLKLHNIPTSFVVSAYRLNNPNQFEKVVQPEVKQEQFDYDFNFKTYLTKQKQKFYEKATALKRAPLYKPQNSISYKIQQVKKAEIWKKRQEKEKEGKTLESLNKTAMLNFPTGTLIQVLEKDSELLDPGLLEFYFRFMTKKIKDDPNIKKYVQVNMNDSICDKIFYTVMRGKLQQNYKLAHELFFFSSQYFKSNEEDESPRPLFNLIRYKDPKNEFIHRLDNLIEFFVSDVVRNYELEHTQGNADFEFIYVPSRHEIVKRPEIENDIFSILNRRAIIECCKNLYSFLQLICQNNFILFKRELREQITEDGLLKPNNKNLLLRSTIELRKVLKVFDDKINDVPLKIINFLNEIAQIPCYENQLELAESTFFGDICHFILNPALFTSGFHSNTLQEIAVIIEQFLKIIISLLESNQQEIYSFICNRLHSQFFRKVPQIYQNILQKTVENNKDKPMVISQKILRIKSTFVIIYKLLKNYPNNAESLITELQSIFAAEKPEPKYTVVTSIGEQIEQSVKRARRAQKRVKISFSSMRNQLWKGLFSIAKAALTYLFPDETFDMDLPLKEQTYIDYEEPHEKILKMQDPALAPDNYNYMLREVLSIEVSIEDNLHTLYFFRPEEAQGMDEDNNEEMQKILYRVDRSAQNAKLSSLVDELPGLQLFMKYERYVKETNYCMGQYILDFIRTANFISIIINILLVFTTQIKIDNETHQSHTHIMTYIMTLLKISQTVSSTLYIFSYITNKIKKQQMKKYIQDQEKNRKQNEAKQRLHRLKVNFSLSKTNIRNHFITIRFSQLYMLLFKSSSVIIYWVISLLGLFVSPYYYSAHVFYLFSKVKVLENVYRAVIQNLQELVFLAFVSICIFFVLSVLVIGIFAPYSQQPCHTILECLVVVYNREAYMTHEDMIDPNLRTLAFETVFSVIFGSLLGNIISGLFTDKFAELRSLHDKVMEDEANQCYICGQSRHNIEKMSNSRTTKVSKKFEFHKQFDHNKWNYLYYLYQLKQKKSTDYTGIEYFIEAKWRDGNNSWLPVSVETSHDVRDRLIEMARQL